MNPHAGRSVLGKVTVSVVSHRQAPLAMLLLADLNQLCRSAINKVVLTCNLPEPLALDPASFQFPIQTIINPTPVGFGANHNQAFQRCDSEWFLVINPDVRLTFDVINTLVVRATDRTGLLAPQETDEAGRDVQNLRGLITPWEVIQRKLLMHERQPPKLHGWVKGMFMLIKTEAYQEIGGFDERYFMYCEDFDLCARLMLQGWSVDHHADLRVMHTWQRQSHRSIGHLAQHLRSMAMMWNSSAYKGYRKKLTPP